MKKEVKIIQSVINNFEVNNLGMWLFLKSGGEKFSSYGDIDLFIVFDANSQNNFYTIAKDVSRVAYELTMKLNKYVSIYPIERSIYFSSKSQFMKNLKSKNLKL